MTASPLTHQERLKHEAFKAFCRRIPGWYINRPMKWMIPDLKWKPNERR